MLDIDICGPSIPKMFGVEGQEIHQSNLGWSPVYVEDNLAVMSIGACSSVSGMSVLGVCSSVSRMSVLGVC